MKNRWIGFLRWMRTSDLTDLAEAQFEALSSSAPMRQRAYESLDVLRFVQRIGAKAGKLYGGDWPGPKARRACWSGCKVKFPGLADDTELHPFLEPLYVFAYRYASSTSGSPQRMGTGS